MISIRIAVALLLTVITPLPSLAQSSGEPQTESLGEPAEQSAFSGAMLRRIGTALLHVSIIRRDYARLERSTDTPQQRQELAAQAQLAMEKAVIAEGLSLQQYDQAMLRAQIDPELKEQLLTIARQALERQ